MDSVKSKLNRQAEYERIGRERLEAERDATRVRNIDLLVTSLQVIGSCVLGLALVGLALHVTDHDLGMIFWWGGLVVGYAGMTIAIARGYRRGVERGDW